MIKSTAHHTLLLVAALALFAAFSYRVSQASPQQRRELPTRHEKQRASTTPPRAVIAETPNASVAPPSSLPATVTATPKQVRTPLATAFPSLSVPTTGWQQFNPETLTVAPHADLPMQFARASVKHDGPYTTWIGRNAALPGASLVTVATTNGYDAILFVPGSSQFSFHVNGDSVVITEAAPGEEGCGVAPHQADRPAATAGGLSISEVMDLAKLQPKEEVITTTVTTLVPASPVYVDVLIGYDADTLAAAAKLSSDAVGYIDRQAKAMIETANTFLAQSNVATFSWRYLGVIATPAYTRDGTSLRDVNALTDATMLRDWVLDTRYRRGADQFLLLVGGSMDFGGRAYSNVQTPVDPSRAVGVMRWNASAKTLAHELAHNFGCQHDRAHVIVNAPGDYGPPAPDNNGVWAYGQMWQNGKLPPGSTGTSGTGGTIMSYADWIVPYFSNPELTIRVSGFMFNWSWNPDLGAQQLGRSVSDPQAAYNALVLSENGVKIADFEEAIQAPAITTQPRNTSVMRGGSFLLSVSATGGGLSYQWRRGGTDIAGATGTSFTKIVETDEPQAYSVVVSNLAGTVTSDSVSITVTAPPPPVNPSSSSGGGGGGGAPSVWFLAVAAAGLAGRYLRNKPR